MGYDSNKNIDIYIFLCIIYPAKIKQEIEMRSVLTLLLLLAANPALAFNKQSAVDSLLATANEFAPDAGITREMLERLSPHKLRLWTMADCQGANKQASFEVAGNRIVAFAATC